MDYGKVFSRVSEFFEREFNGNETKQLLKVNLMKYWSWGVSLEVGLKSPKSYPDTIGGLLLRVQGHHHKGYVLITLGWDDTYTFRLLNNDYKELEKVENVYFDELVNRIDEKIEKIPEYTH
jgi:hypothetical protein